MTLCKFRYYYTVLFPISQPLLSQFQGIRILIFSEVYDICKEKQGEPQRHKIKDKSFYFEMQRNPAVKRNLIGKNFACLKFYFIFPSTDIVTTLISMDLPLYNTAFLTAAVKPPQQGTSILTTVISFISLFFTISSNFSL